MADGQEPVLRIGKGKPGPGRPRGSRDKLSMQVREMVEHALTKAGGVKYLVQQSKENPRAFLALVGRCISPVDTREAEDGNGVVLTEVTWRVVSQR